VRREPDNQEVTDAEQDEDLHRFAKAAMRAGFSYSESSGDLRALCSILKLCGVVASGLAIAGIGGAIVMYGKVEQLQSEVADLKVTVDHVYRLVEPHYRGAPESADSAGQ